MKTQKLLYSFVCLLSTVIVAGRAAYAQSYGDGAYAQPLEHPTVYSPQVQAMVRYDNQNVNLNTGTVSLTVPLLDFNDPDFNVDMSMTYSMDGFKPLIPDNYVGMGWRLNCGGVITREVYGIPDEFLNYPAAPNRFGYNASVSGYMGESQPTADLLIEADSTILNSNFIQTPVGTHGDWEAIVSRNSWVEKSPDIFRFSFGNHSGLFIMDGNNVLVSSDTGKNYKVEFLAFTRTPLNQNKDNVIMSIKITTDDGYQYFFGGDYSTIEYTALRWSDITSDGLVGDSGNLSFPSFDALNANSAWRYNEPVAFHLSKIIAPNGRELIYEYYDWVPDEVHENPEMFILAHSSIPSSSANDLLKSYTITPSLTAPAFLAYSVEQLELNYTLTKSAFVKSICSDSQQIDFYYSSYPCPYFCLDRHIDSGHDYDHRIYNYLSQCGAKLESVRLTYGSQDIQETTLSYKNNEKRLILAEVNNSKEGYYRFSYNPCKMQKSLTMDIDKWGFWNGANSNRYFRPEETPIINSERMEYTKVAGDRNRETSGNDCAANMLNSATFPTGGSILYYYQPHDYSRYYEQSYNNGYIPEMRETLTPRELAGGARIYKEIFNDGIDFKSNRTKVYEYLYDDGRSSGALKMEGDNYLGRYVLSYRYVYDKYGNYDIDYNPDKYELTYSPIYSGKNILRKNGIGGYIEYSQVSEYDYDGRLNNFNPDSLYTISRSVLDGATIAASISIPVGGQNMNEHLSTWTITGTASQGQSGRSYCAIKRNGVVLWEYTFSTSKEVFTLYPLDEFGEGDYEIYYEVGQYSSFRFDANYPKHNAIINSLPRKVSTFTETPLHYEDKHFKPLDKVESYLSSPNPIYEQNARSFLDRYYSKPIDLSGLGGKLLCEKYYDSENRLRKSVTTDYQTIYFGDAATINYYPKTPGTTTHCYYQVLRVPIYTSIPLAQAVVEYDEFGNSFETKQTYCYNEQGYISASIKHDSGGGSIRTEYSYPFDYSDEVYQVMVDRNILSPIISQTVMTEDLEIIYANQVEYGLQENMEYPDTQLFPLIASISDTYGDDPLELRMEYASYDCYGNPLCVISDNRDYVYLWSYLGKYMVAKIDNATEDDVLDALEVEQLSEISQMPLPPNDIGSILRSSLPNSMVTTYTYVPGIGLSSETGPDGFTLYYDYDKSGRLACKYYIEEGYKSIIEKYEYNLINK